VLVLDEPTNDLDLETLELLEQQLVEWPGTLLIVSHDRRFLDNVVTSTLAFEGHGAVQEYVGGYEDYVRQRPAPAAAVLPASERRRESSTAKAIKKKRTFKEEREYAELPARIAALEDEQKQIQTSLADPDFYKRPGSEIAAAVSRGEQIERELVDAMTRWDVLDSI
jgi:ATP-binding cassette subfamily F protein uup